MNVLQIGRGICVGDPGVGGVRPYDWPLAISDFAEKPPGSKVGGVSAGFPPGICPGTKLSRILIGSGVSLVPPNRGVLPRTQPLRLQAFAAIACNYMRGFRGRLGWKSSCPQSSDLRSGEASRELGASCMSGRAS